MRTLLLTFAGLATLCALAASATATPSTTFTITTSLTFSPSGPTGTFTATGLPCTAGTFADEFVGGPLIRKSFACAGGTFTIQFHTLHATFDPDTGIATFSGPCNFLSGTGSFAGVQGTCDFSVVVNVNTATGTETLSGDVHFDP
jgi:hypothetical protein